MISLLAEMIGCVGVADLNDGTYRVDLADGTSRLATDAEVLAVARRMRHTARYEALLAARNGGFLFAGGVVESDQESRILITGAAQLAALAMMAGTQQALDDFSASLGAGWRYADGGIAATTAQGMIALGQALAARIAQCDAISQAHKAAIDAAETVAECLAIDVTAGY